MIVTDLSLKEKLFILSLGEKGFTGTSFLGFGLAGAGILELVQSGKADEKGKMLVLKSTKHTNDAILDYFTDTIRQSSKKKKIKHWVAKFGNRPGRLKKLLIPEMLEKKIIRKVKKRFLIFKYYRYPVYNSSIREELIKSMISYSRSKKDGDDELLFLLCGAIKIFNKVFSDKANRKKANAIFKELKKKDFVISGVTEAVQAVQAAILASVVITSAAASTAGR